MKTKEKRNKNNFRAFKIKTTIKNKIDDLSKNQIQNLTFSQTIIFLPRSFYYLTLEN